MATIPDPINSTVNQIYNSYVSDNDDVHRAHLGASIIGHHCRRYLWLTFHWADKPLWSGRMLRLFDTGKKEEARFIGDLRRIGCDVRDADIDGSQFRVSAVGGHFGGSMDGKAKGIPEAPATWHALEFKTHNDKSFGELKAKGVKEAKPMHYDQMTVYMGLDHLDRAAYLAVNKNTDELYFERIHFDADHFAKLMSKATDVITSQEPPERVSVDPSWWQCKGCTFFAQCHQTAAPLVNCRTCCHSTADVMQDEGVWTCDQFGNIAIPEWHQRKGCDQHRFIPIMLRNFAEMTDANGTQNVVQYRNNKTGQTFINGNGGLSSQEIRSCEDKAALGDPDVDLIRKEFDARIVA